MRNDNQFFLGSQGDSKHFLYKIYITKNKSLLKKLLSREEQRYMWAHIYTSFFIKYLFSGVKNIISLNGEKGAWYIYVLWMKNTPTNYSLDVMSGSGVVVITGVFVALEVDPLVRRRQTPSLSSIIPIRIGSSGYLERTSPKTVYASLQ